MAGEPGERMPPMSLVDYTAIDSGIPSPPYVLSVYGPDLLSNWDSSDMDVYREKRGRWQDAIVRYLSSIFPGLADGVGLCRLRRLHRRSASRRRLRRHDPARKLRPSWY